MLEHLKKNESELNELLAEYWNLRHQTGRCHLNLSFVRYPLTFAFEMFTWRHWPIIGYRSFIRIRRPPFLLAI